MLYGLTGLDQQAASGAGAPGMNELMDETKKFVTTGEMPANKVFAHPLPLNVIPHIDVFQVTLDCLDFASQRAEGETRR